MYRYTFFSFVKHVDTCYCRVLSYIWTILTIWFISSTFIDIHRFWHNLSHSHLTVKSSVHFPLSICANTYAYDVLRCIHFDRHWIVTYTHYTSMADGLSTQFPKWHTCANTAIQNFTRCVWLMLQCWIGKVVFYVITVPKVA